MYVIHVYFAMYRSVLSLNIYNQSTDLKYKYFEVKRFIWKSFTYKYIVLK